ncbi:MATE family efflux transporter [Alkalimarinus alittae]|uniref:MATE family efflux transporter n=1 Tax=Alkalimarinus alittae TaxID=2961619 RepID=A0ABY6N2Y8_9ALTE|nr:MATE family efflux transporter [Alkalimarinus alittae]UZE96390.1 MATE family efflux transporter [Alkalimarinus alittae]
MTTNTCPPVSLSRALFQMTWPMLFGVLSLMSFQLADSIFIGQLGVDPLAAVGFTVPMYQLIIGVQVGLGIATTALISKALGQKQTDHAKQLGGVVIIIGATSIALLCLLLWFLRAPILNMLGGEPSLLPTLSIYWMPWLASAWVGAMLYFGYSLCRAHGNTMLPGITMVFTSLLNIALDPLFIFVFDWGLAGAPYATITSFSLGCLIIYPKIISRQWLAFNITPDSMFSSTKQLGGITGPAMLSQFMPSLSSMFATSLVAVYGTSAVAAWGLGTRLEFFSIVIVLALTMSMPPMVGRYWGAGDLESIRQLVKLAVKFVLLWQLAIAVIWLLLSDSISGLMTTDLSVAAVLKNYLLSVPLSYGALGICMIMVSVCNAMGLPMRALVISCLRLFLCYLPLLWLGSKLDGLDGLMSGAMVGNLAAGLMAWVVYQKGLKKAVKRHQTVDASITLS